MKVTTVSASVRFSKALGDGQHKTVELGAEAKLEPGDTMEAAIAQLYADLGHELKSLWGNGNGNGHAKAEAGVPAGIQVEKDIKAAAEPQPTQTPAHWCSDHGKAFNRFEKEGKVWYSHKGPDGHWCREK